MSKGRLFFLGSLLAAGLLTGCDDDARRQARIPLVPGNSAEIRNQKALEALTRAINRNAPASAYARRAALFLENGRLNEALSDIDEALDRDDDVGRYHLIKAQILRGQHKLDDALESAQRAEGLGVNTPELYVVMGDLLQQKKQFDRARLYLAKVLQMAPYEGEAFHFNGLVAARQGDTVRALNQYARALSLKPRYLDTYTQLTSIYTALGDLQTALNYNQRAITYFPQNAQLYHGRGLIYHRGYQLDSAARYYQRAIQLQPDLYAAHFQLGLVYLKYKAFGQALRHFEEVARGKPDYPRVNLYLAVALEYTGQLDRALELLTKESELNPYDYQVRSGLWRVQRKQYGYYGGNTQPEEFTKEEETPTRPGSVLDTTRVRIRTIQPRSRFSVSNDSTRN
ncbi:tetratricopeptide repeat protein [Tellurirhabdus rosea]|uniref:tetratricopeptide repeat protein n=1 Tax=Tellurirhabdus rosea TaxID=2674997 RepID=UPI00225BD253|nr:tetratricopeptide repeat protein [Tellurirhabdus rosea]